MEIPKVTWRNHQWIHLTSFNQELAEWLQKEYQLHDLDLEDCLAGKAQQPKRENYPDYNFFILHFPFAVATARGRFRINVVQVHFFVSANTLITLVNDPVPLIEQTFKSLKEDQKLREEWFEQGPGFVFHQVVDALTDNTIRVVDRIGKQIDTIDNQLTQLKRQVIEDISLSRRNLIVTTTIIKPMVRIFTDLETTQVSYLNGELKEYWSNIKDHLMRMSELLADNTELLTGLTESFDVLLTHKTNQIIKILTIFSVVLLPLTLLSGIYGMNISLPLADSQYAFIFILCLMLTISVSMLGFFKYKDWI